MTNIETLIGSGACLCPVWTLKLYARMRALTGAVLTEPGQDLIEYALVASLIALAAVAGMKTVATALGTAFVNIGTNFTNYTS